MQLISEMGYDPAFAKQASQAGYIFRDGMYFTPDQIQAYESIPYRQRTDTIYGGLTQQQVAGKLQQTSMRRVPDQQQQYAIDRQKSLSESGAQQQQQQLQQLQKLQELQQQQKLQQLQQSQKPSQQQQLQQQQELQQQQKLQQLQQLQSMTQRNTATDEALANAKATSGPGRSAYDQRLQQMMLGSFTPDDPSYQWRMEQGMTNLARSGAAKGMLGSGNMAAELLTFGQGMASQEYGAQFNRLLQASTNATNQYTAAYSVLDQMLQQQRAQQGLGLEGEKVAQGWETTAQNWDRVSQGWDSAAQGWENLAQGRERIAQGWESAALGREGMAQNWGQLAQGWGGQNLGYTNADTQEYAATTSAQANAATLGLRRDAFNAEQQRLDNWNQGQGAALMQGAGRIQQQPAQQSYYVQQSNPGVGGYGPVQNNAASQLSSGTGYIQNNSTGAVSQLGGGGQGYQSWGNDYGYEAVYGD